jgi:hypothetical protein
LERFLLFSLYERLNEAITLRRHIGVNCGSIESMKYLKGSAILLTLTLASLMAAGIPDSSPTPDGETPAEESVCDELDGASPGLYGLCVAYCEAQDCDFEAARSGQCNAPNPKLLGIYDKKRGTEDPPMPCLVPEAECPCFGAEDLAALSLDTCEGVDFGTVVNLILTDSSGQGGESGPDGAFAEMNLGDGSGRCMYHEMGPSGPILSDSATDPVQTQACLQLMEENVEDHGLTCVSRD